MARSATAGRCIKPPSAAILCVLASFALALASAVVWSTEAYFQLYPYYGKVGFIRRDGVVVVPPTYDDLGHFASNGLAPVRVGMKWGYVDTAGKLVITPRFYAASDFGSSGIAEVVPLEKDKGFELIDGRGRPIANQRFDIQASAPTNPCVFSGFDPPYEIWQAPPFSHGMLPVPVDGRMRYIGTDGRFALTQIFDAAEPFSNSGLAPVCKGGKWGYIDTHGRIVIRPDYDDAEGFDDDGLAIVARGQNVGSLKYGFIDTRGAVVAPLRYSSLQHYGVGAPQGMALASLDETHGMLDKKGNFTPTPWIDGRYSYSDHRLVRYESEWDPHRITQSGFKDFQGRVVIPAQFGDVGDFSDGLARVKVEVASFGGTRFGYIDATGAWKLPPVFECADDFSADGLAIVKKGGQWGFIDVSGAFVVKSPEIPTSGFSTSGYARIATKNPRYPHNATEAADLGPCGDIGDAGNLHAPL